MSEKKNLKKQIIEFAREYYREVHCQMQEIIPGVDL